MYPGIFSGSPPHRDGGFLIPVGQAKTMSGIAGVFHCVTSFLEPAGETPVDIIFIVDQHHA
jgi:hypothetical protein